MAQPAHRPEDRGPPPPGETVELRVHGVGGAGPERLLDVPVTELVAGDESAGFFRPWAPPGTVPLSREGYSWGGLTSASSLRALWVLLTPFALANLAGWMLRHGGEPTDREVRERRLLESAALASLRVFGGLLTASFAIYLTVAAADLVAYQCGARPSCSGGRWWMAPWESALVAGRPARAVALGAMAVVAVVAGTAWLARRSQLAIHQRLPFSGKDDPALRVNLWHPRLWRSPHVAHRLGLAHTAVALAAVGTTLGAAASAGGVAVPGGAAAGWWVLVLSALALIRLEGVGPALHWALLAAAVLQLGVVLGGLWVDEGMVASPGSLPDSWSVATALLPAYPLVALATGVSGWWLWRREHPRRLHLVFIAPGLLLAAAGLVHAFGAGLLIRLADLVGTPVPASRYPLGRPSRQPQIVYPDAVADVAVVTVFALAVTVVVVAVALLAVGRGGDCSELAGRFADRGGLDCGDPEDVSWARGVARAEAMASVTDHAGFALGVVTVVVVAAVALAVALSGDTAGLGLGATAARSAEAASVVIGLIPVVAVWVIARLYRSRPGRRLVGILWDVATFWPRWFHPWAPPPYGERAVPQLADRVAVLTEAGRVVLSAHSQGSVLALATVLAEDVPSDRLRLLTHGSPLQRLYARYFPECFSTELFAQARDRVGGWVNLWRRTDFIGGPLPVLGEADREVIDPPATRPPARGEPRPRPLRHSDYDRTPEYAAALAELSR